MVGTIPDGDVWSVKYGRIVAKVSATSMESEEFLTLTCRECGYFLSCLPADAKP